MGASVLEGVDEASRILTELSVMNYCIFRLQEYKFVKMIRRDAGELRGSNKEGLTTACELAEKAYGIESRSRILGLGQEFEKFRFASKSSTRPWNLLFLVQSCL